jgi:hypothetical protein
VGDAVGSEADGLVVGVLLGSGVGDGAGVRRHAPRSNIPNNPKMIANWRVENRYTSLTSVHFSWAKIIT